MYIGTLRFRSVFSVGRKSPGYSLDPRLPQRMLYTNDVLRTVISRRNHETSAEVQSGPRGHSHDISGVDTHGDASLLRAEPQWVPVKMW